MTDCTTAVICVKRIINCLVDAMAYGLTNVRSNAAQISEKAFEVRINYFQRTARPVGESNAVNT